MTSEINYQNTKSKIGFFLILGTSGRIVNLSVNANHEAVAKATSPRVAAIVVQQNEHVVYTISELRHIHSGIDKASASLKQLTVQAQLSERVLALPSTL
jgi:hypothetical protein